MDIGIGLPSTIPGVTRDQELEWARRADARGFSTLGVIDRIVYSNLEPLIALAAAAAVTERIRLTTSILLGPTRGAALLAKQAASVNLLSDGRLTLGLAPGGRADDYEAVGVDFGTRGAASTSSWPTCSGSGPAMGSAPTTSPSSSSAAPWRPRSGAPRSTAPAGSRVACRPTP